MCSWNSTLLNWRAIVADRRETKRLFHINKKVRHLAQWLATTEASQSVSDSILNSIKEFHCEGWQRPNAMMFTARNSE